MGINSKLFKPIAAYFRCGVCRTPAGAVEVPVAGRVGVVPWVLVLGVVEGAGLAEVAGVAGAVFVVLIAAQSEGQLGILVPLLKKFCNWPL